MTPRNGNVEVVSGALEDLRLRIRGIEKELSKYGFDPRRGIESYKISELKKLLDASGNNRRAVEELLLRLIEMQETLYKKLYELASLREINVDTDTPEKRLIAIKEWLLGGKVNARQPCTGTSRFSQAVLKVLDAIGESSEDDARKKRILEMLRRMYKRDYDRYRVLRFILSTCMEVGIIDDTPLKRAEDVSLEELVKDLPT